MNRIQVTQATFFINLDNPTEVSYEPMEGEPMNGNWKTIIAQTYPQGFPEIKDDEILYVYKDNKGYGTKGSRGYILNKQSNNMEEQQTEKGTINIAQPKSFKIDFTKVTSLDDVVAILNGMDLTVYSYDDTIPEKFKDLFDKELLVEVPND